MVKVQLATEEEWLLVLELAFQLGYGLLQVLHDEIHVRPGGTATHAEPDCIPGHVYRNATAQQHWGWPAEEGEHWLLLRTYLPLCSYLSARPSKLWMCWVHAVPTYLA